MELIQEKITFIYAAFGICGILGMSATGKWDAARVSIKRDLTDLTANAKQGQQRKAEN